MTITPLFVDDLAAIQTALRLTDLREGSDAVSILEQGVRMARVRFYQRLGPVRVAEILETVYTDAPINSEETLRMVANLCEVEIVRLELLDRMPVIFMDASGSAREAFNTEGAFRSMDRESLKLIRARIETQIDNWMALLAEEIELGEGEAAQVYTQEAPCPRPILGATPFLTPTGEPLDTLPGSFDGNFIADDEVEL